MLRAEHQTIEEAAKKVGKEVGLSSWRVVSQEMIDQFASATDDHQFVHTDPERAATESPYGTTIAHGFLSLSLLSAMTFETITPVAGASIGVNFGFERVRFMAPVMSGARIRARFILAHFRPRPSGIIEVNYDVTIEIENLLKPALTAYWMTLLMPDRRNEAFR